MNATDEARRAREKLAAHFPLEGTSQKSGIFVICACGWQSKMEARPDGPRSDWAAHAFAALADAMLAALGAR